MVCFRLHIKIGVVTDVEGLKQFCLMAVVLNFGLFFFNLLPIPVLDGGAIFLLLIEGLLGLIGLSISAVVRDRIQQVGFVMVLLLMVFVISNDLIKTFGGSSEQPRAPASSSAPAK